MTNPVLVEVTRGPLVESRHRGAIAVYDETGAAVFELGDVSSPVYPRSAIKALQAIRLVESGGADAFGLSPRQLAVICSSHNGEPAQVETVQSILQAAGLTGADLECGPQWPKLDVDIARLNKAVSAPSAVHNNCSGKHSGMLALARHLGHKTAGYIAPDHPVQLEIRGVLQDMTQSSLSAETCGSDGCSVPTYAAPLSAMARGFATFVSGNGLRAVRADACRRLLHAVMDEPHMVAGTGRFCTQLMTTLSGKVFVKTGAEGVFCGAIPGLNLGIAIKCDDGATRAAEIIMANVLSRLLKDDARALIKPFQIAKVENRNAWHVGDVRPVDRAFDAISH